MARPDAGVATGRLDDRAARLQQPVAFGGEDHLQRRPILRRAAGVGGFHLHRQHTVDAMDLAGALQADQWRVADGVEHAVGDRVPCNLASAESSPQGMRASVLVDSETSIASAAACCRWPLRRSAVSCGAAFGWAGGHDGAVGECDGQLAVGCEL